MAFISIRWRLVATYVLLTALTVGLLGTVALTLVQQNVEAQERDYLSANATVVADRAADLISPVADRYSLQGLADTAAFLGNARVRILDARRTVLADSGPRSSERILWIAPVPGLNTLTDRPITLFGFINLREEDPPMSVYEQRLVRLLVPEARFTLVDRESKAVGSKIEFGQQARSMAELDSNQLRRPNAAPATEGSARLEVPIVLDGRTVGSVELSSSISYTVAALTTARNAFALAALSVTLLAVAAGVWVSRSLTRPISTLAAATNRMAGGDLSARAPAEHAESPRNEVDLLAAQFNTMADRLEASFSQLQAERDALRQFISEASHELRTPITALRMSNELLQGPAGEDAATRAEFLAQNDAQLRRLQWITSHLLDMSRMDAGLMQLDLGVHDVSDVISAAAEPFRLRAEQKGVTLNIAPPNAPLRLRCDRARIEMALTNLIDNALKFTPTGGAIVVHAAAHGKTIALRVTDNGPGIPPDDVPHVFERFYRARNAAAEGSGLGLAIVKSIAQAHNGSVRLDSALGVGTDAAIELPA